MEESSAEMESGQKKAVPQNIDVLDQINSLQAYLEKMKERVINGEISNTDTKTALQNLNVNFKVITVTFSLGMNAFLVRRQRSSTPCS